MKLVQILTAIIIGGILATIALLTFPQIYLGLKWRIPLHDYEYRQAANQYLLRLDNNLAADRLILIGDSHIESMDTSGFSPRAANFGIGGDTWAGLSERIPMYKSLNHTKAIVVLAGINDLRSTPIPNIIKDAESAIKKIPAGKPLYIISVLPIAEAHIPILLSDIKLLNKELSKICLKNCVFVDAHSAFLNPDGSVDTALLEVDGIHLNRRGYDQLKKIIQLSIPIKDGSSIGR